MRSRLTRGMVSALGERGDIALDLVPQLLPTVDIGNLGALGFPVGLPVAFGSQRGASAGNRTGFRIGAPAGMVVRIDRIRADGIVEMNYGVDNVWTPSLNWTIVERSAAPRAPTLGAGVLLAVQGLHQTAALWGSGLTAKSPIATAWPANADYPGPVFVDDKRIVDVFAAADNTVLTLHIWGEAFETE